MDDMMYDAPRWIKDVSIKDIFMNGRHFNLMFLVTMQFSLGLPPSFRANCDIIFVLRETYVSNRRRLYEHYAGMFPTFEIFCQVMNQCTENYECLVINNTVRSNKLEDCVFWYKATDHPPFKLGAPEFWQYHSQNYSEGGGDEEDDVDINSLQKKKNSIAINVKKSY
jgi:hypothetical protein